MMVVKTLSK